MKRAHVLLLSLALSAAQTAEAGPPGCFSPSREEYFGGPPEVSLHVRPLEGQSLETRPETSTAPGVRVEGAAAVTRSEVVEDNRLPPGKYLLSVRLAGSRNWDRQVTYFEVAK